MDAFPIASLPEFPNDEQLPASAFYSGQTNLEDVHVEAVKLTRETVPVN
jgi:hypothetical protein